MMQMLVSAINTPQAHVTESAEDAAQRKKMRAASINRDEAAANNQRAETISKLQDIEIKLLKSIKDAELDGDNDVAAIQKMRLKKIQEQIDKNLDFA